MKSPKINLKKLGKYKRFVIRYSTELHRENIIKRSSDSLIISNIILNSIELYIKQNLNYLTVGERRVSGQMRQQFLQHSFIYHPHHFVISFNLIKY